MVDWLNECLYSHDVCGSRGRSALPDRVIDLAPMDEDHDPQLKELVSVSIEAPGEGEKTYVCLSHCWGEGTPLKLTRRNLNRFKEAIPRDDLPRTFKDAMAITRDIGIRFLWIDSLCIIQDDQADWVEQAGKMALIYANSVVTIAAQASADGNGGCFRTCDEGEREVFMVPSQSDPSQKGTLCCRKAFQHFSQSDPPLMKPDRLTVPLLTRAWAYQEHLLAPRVLQYTANECVWECNASTRCMCGRSNFSPPNIKMLHIHELPFSHQEAETAVASGSSHTQTIPSISLSNVHHYWRTTVVQGYTSRNLSFPSDRLPALSGVATQVCEVMRKVSSKTPRYLAGLWSDDLLNGLSWMAAGGETDLEAGTKSMNSAPTWSWASVAPSSTRKQNVIHWYTSLDKSKPLAGIMDASCITASADPFGSVSSGFIKLRAPTIEAQVIYDTDKDYGIVTYFVEFHDEQ